MSRLHVLRRLSRCAFAALAGVSAVLSALPAHAEIQVTDVLGRQVTLAQPAERVALGFYFEDYIAITGPSAIDRLAAVSLNYWKGYRPLQYEAYLRRFPQLAGLADFGDADSGTLSAEKIIATKPDVAILSAGQFDYLGAAASAIEAAGIPLVVVDYNAQTVARHVASTLVIGRVMGTEDRARELAENYEAMMADTERRVASAAPATKPVVYVELGQKGPAETGNSYGKGMWAGVIDKAGGLNIAAGKVGNWGPLAPEYVLSSRPDFVFLTGSEWQSMPNALLMGFDIDRGTTLERLAAYLSRPGWKDLPAIEGGHLYAVYHGGVRSLVDYVYLRYIAKALHPTAFEDVDPRAELVSYYRRFLPIEPKGTFMLRLPDGAAQ
ncbi:ABC-type Fe3+-hydroxamate transport system, substrate-binding protein [Tistlia consotensis]|uniref:ABC-type Fe3+-hydroxamate transport system, substrate-binding protein n=1 Tax=Tistlia consotensis USBA 355 TaxID=560819 RepID=A0A1Y6CLS8_9PROT|nr:ABC transporter substrate-binding protein [Tistlia consotensis]SMF76322.1 ABC-type Fe3+-hydroxamate transport system, substrate-binding protein [Tistlia consotensis USBA 355]SNS12656.1 ABC-type Fe3+-hydroxamate transport system, substrate-binding protein [Tistlia consotensis]